MQLEALQGILIPARKYALKVKEAKPFYKNVEKGGPLIGTLEQVINDRDFYFKHKFPDLKKEDYDEGIPKKDLAAAEALEKKANAAEAIKTKEDLAAATKA